MRMSYLPGVFITSLLLVMGLACTASNTSAQDLKDMISPMSHPTNFEDPRHSTELRPIFLYHELDDKFATTGGDVRIFAIQARFKMSDDLSFIATKDGYVDFNPDATLESDEGFANIGLGFKYSPIVNDDYIITTGLRYEIPLGERKVLQGNGDGMINPFVSAGTIIGNWNIMAGTGFRFRIDDADSSFYDLDLHLSYRMGNFYPLVELGLIHVIDEGSRLPIPDEGQDFFNLGASESSGKTISTVAFGGRYRLTDNWDIGASYQLPIDTSSGTRILDYRVTADMIFRFSLS